MTWPRLEHESVTEAGRELASVLQVTTPVPWISLAEKNSPKRIRGAARTGGKQQVFPFQEQHLLKQFKLLPLKILPCSIGANSTADDKKQAKKMLPVGVTVSVLTAGMLLSGTPMGAEGVNLGLCLHSGTGCCGQGEHTQNYLSTGLFKCNECAFFIS